MLPRSIRNGFALLVLITFLCPLQAADAPSRVFSSGTSLTPTEKAWVEDRQKVHVVCVAVNDYTDERIPDLRCPENDASRLVRVLSDPDTGGVPIENIAVLSGSRAHKAAVIKALTRLQNLSSDAFVFIYFSGHGQTFRDRGYLLPIDSDIDDLPGTAISREELHLFLNDIPAKRKLLVLDCCHSGAVANAKSPMGPTNFLEKFTGAGCCFLSAADKAELALEMPDKAESLFSHFLTRGLRGEADRNEDGVVTLSEVVDFLDLHVADEARRRNGSQRPVVDMDSVVEPGKFLLARNAPVVQRLEKLRKDRLESLWSKALKKDFPVTTYTEGRRILGASREELSPLERGYLPHYENFADDKITLDKLIRSLQLVDAEIARASSTPQPVPPPTPTRAEVSSQSGQDELAQLILEYAADEGRGNASDDFIQSIEGVPADKVTHVLLNEWLSVTGDDELRRESQWGRLSQGVRDAIGRHYPIIQTEVNETDLRSVPVWRDRDGRYFDTFCSLTAPKLAFTVAPPEATGPKEWSNTFSRLRQMSEQATSTEDYGHLLKEVSKVQSELRAGRIWVARFSANDMLGWCSYRECQEAMSEFESSIRAARRDLTQSLTLPFQGRTLQTLIAFLAQSGLKFGPARSPAAQDAYHRIYVSLRTRFKELQRLRRNAGSVAEALVRAPQQEVLGNRPVNLAPAQPAVPVQAVVR